MIPLQKLSENVIQNCDNSDPSHDVLHLQRVVTMCEKLGAQLNANLPVLLSAAWLHDIVNLPKNHPERVMASQKAAAAAQKILLDLNYTQDDISKILQIILEHSYSAGHKPTSLESQILQDADRLDALGAIGVLRLASCGARMQAQFYESTDPFAQNRDLDDKQYSIDHIYKKLLKLADGMNTDPAKEMAKSRTEFLEVFLKQLQQEINSRQ